MDNELEIKVLHCALDWLSGVYADIAKTMQVGCPADYKYSNEVLKEIGCYEEGEEVECIHVSDGRGECWKAWFIDKARKEVENADKTDN